MTKNKQLKVTLIRSFHGCLKNHIACVRGLGLRKMHSEAVLENTPSVRGMVNKIAYLLKIEEI